MLERQRGRGRFTPPETLLGELESVINSEPYGLLQTKKEKLTALQNIVTRRDKTARDMMLAEEPDLQETINRAKIDREAKSGMSFSFN